MLQGWILYRYAVVRGKEFTWLLISELNSSVKPRPCSIFLTDDDMLSAVETNLKLISRLVSLPLFPTVYRIVFNLQIN